jgi:hypothetical protein
LIDAVDEEIDSERIDKPLYTTDSTSYLLSPCLCVRRNPNFPLSDCSKGMISAPLTVYMEVILIQFHLDDDDDDDDFFSENYQILIEYSKAMPLRFEDLTESR